MSTSPKTLRNRNLTAAKRSLKLILDELGKHQTALENGEIPEGSIAASLVKYETGLIVLRTLDALGKDYVEAGPQENGEAMAEVSRDDLSVMVQVLEMNRAVLGMPDTVAPDSPLGRLAAAAREPAETAGSTA